MNVEMLAAYIPNTGAYRGKAMSPDEVRDRRSYIRQQLRGSRFDNLSNDTLDKCMYEDAGGQPLFTDENGYTFALESKKVLKDLSEFRRLNAEIPFEYLDIKTKDFNWSVYGRDMSDGKEILNKYLLNFERVRNEGYGLYIYSKTKGSGKTMLACCVLNELANRQAVNIKFVNVLDLLEMTKKSYDGDRGEVERIRNAAVLCLDDIGVQMSKEWVDTVFYSLINERYSNHKITIYTSNVLPDALKIDDRIIDRIASRSYIITLPEVNVRRSKAEAGMKKLLDK